MIYCLYGADTYRSRQKLGEIVARHREKTGSPLNFYRFDAEEDECAMVKTVIETRSLFNPKKLVVIMYPFSAGARFGSFLDIAQGIKDTRDTVLLLWDQELDNAAGKRMREAQQFMTKIQEFRPLSGEALRRWIREEAGRRGVALTAEAYLHCASFGSNLWAITNELEKCTLAGSVDETDGSARRRHRERNNQSNLFGLGDTFFAAPREAMRHLVELFETGHDESTVFNYMANHARTLLIVKSYLVGNERVSDRHGIHPFVIKKASLAVGALSFERLTAILREFFEEDWRIKTGLSRPYESLLRILNAKDV